MSWNKHLVKQEGKYVQKDEKQFLLSQMIISSFKATDVTREILSLLLPFASLSLSVSRRLLCLSGTG